MIPVQLLKDEVTIYTLVEDETNRYGDTTYTNDDGSTVRAAVWPVGASEDNDQRQTRSNEYMAVLDPEADLDGTSSVEWRGHTFEVIGEPELSVGPAGEAAEHHITIKLRKITG